MRSKSLIVGNGRGYLSAIVTGSVTREQVQAALDAVNPLLPHYKQVRAFRLRPEPFSIENGMLTANGKLKRDLISARLKNEIDGMYQVKQAVIAPALKATAWQSRNIQGQTLSWDVRATESSNCRFTAPAATRSALLTLAELEEFCEALDGLEPRSSRSDHLQRH